jgi:HD-GYP domain-containing protein (c-di-GMP phosphodiesterase class II)
MFVHQFLSKSGSRLASNLLHPLEQMHVATISKTYEVELFAPGHEREVAPTHGRERVVEIGAALSFLTIAVAMAVLMSSPRSLDLPTLAVLIGAYVITCRAKFDIADGYAVPTELVLVPMLFLLPTPLVPLVVSFSWMLGRLFDYAPDKLNARRFFQVFADCSHSLGPALVLVVAGAQVFSWADWPIYVIALLTQFVFDFTSHATRARLIDGTPPLNELRVIGSAYALDATLAPIGLFAAFVAIETGAMTCLLIIPLAATLSILSREREVIHEKMSELRDAYQGTAMLLGDVVEADDAYTGRHSRGVVELSVAVAERLGLEPWQCRNVEFAALLHDVGKISVSKEIINKSGPLDDDEWKIMRQHTVEGEEMLNRVGGVLAEVGRIVRSSHEGYDGSGYPDGLAGKEIPIEARIVTCCDAFSAMTTTRSYRKAMSPEVAVAELRNCAGTQFDPKVVDALIEIVDQ